MYNVPLTFINRSCSQYVFHYLFSNWIKYINNNIIDIEIVINVKFYFSEFVDKSLENYKEFERQKDSDLMNILKDYVAFQTKYAQKVCALFNIIKNLNIVYYYH